MELTPFDSCTTTSSLQMIKLMIPYLPPQMQKMLGIYVKITELTYIMSAKKLHNTKELNMETILSDLGPYMPSEFQQFIEMYEMMQNMDFGNIDLGDLFQPEGSSSYERMDESSTNENA